MIKALDEVCESNLSSANIKNNELLLMRNVLIKKKVVSANNDVSLNNNEFIFKCSIIQK
jgi:hypothetical protein